MILHYQDLSVNVLAANNCYLFYKLLDYGLSGNRISVETNVHHPSRPALGPTQPPIRWVPGLPSGLMRPERGVDHPTLCSTEVKERVQLHPTFSLSLSLFLWALNACFKGNFINKTPTVTFCGKLQGVFVLIKCSYRCSVEENICT